MAQFSNLPSRTETEAVAQKCTMPDMLEFDCMLVRYDTIWYGGVSYGVLNDSLYCNCNYRTGGRMVHIIVRHGPDS